MINVITDVMRILIDVRTDRKTMIDVIIKVMRTQKNVITKSMRMIEVNSANLAISPVELVQMIVGSVFMSAVQKATTEKKGRTTILKTEVKTGIVILTVKSSFNLITENREIYQIMSVVFIKVETQEKPLIEIKPAIITIRTKVYLETKPKVF